MCSPCVTDEGRFVDLAVCISLFVSLGHRLQSNQAFFGTGLKATLVSFCSLTSVTQCQRDSAGVTTVCLVERTYAKVSTRCYANGLQQSFLRSVYMRQ
jgi:hypothetical protein